MLDEEDEEVAGAETANDSKLISFVYSLMSNKNIPFKSRNDFVVLFK
jgi:hypothetical protein